MNEKIQETKVPETIEIAWRVRGRGRIIKGEKIIDAAKVFLPEHFMSFLMEDISDLTGRICVAAMDIASSPKRGEV